MFLLYSERNIYLNTIFVTGGAGFIGSNFLNMFVPTKPEYTFINIDKLTYAANLSNLKAVEKMDNYIFEQASITDLDRIDSIFLKYNPDLVIHFAAESHVDRSILGPSDFIQTNIIGTFNLLEVCRKYWKGSINKLFHHVSTDEVYGSLGSEGLFTETTPYDPRSPYSASKASSDHLVRAYYHTYNLPVKITNCSNNYGPHQFPEKLIPLMITNALSGKPLPVYGDGSNIRDWLYVDDHNRALWTVIERGGIGDTYNIGGNSEKTNLQMDTMICEILGQELDRDPEQFNKHRFSH
jgi:dTDP-glucose 4,6-dehydratase